MRIRKHQVSDLVAQDYRFYGDIILDGEIFTQANIVHRQDFRSQQLFNTPNNWAILIPVAGEDFIIIDDNDWSVDFTGTGINMLTRMGGRVDGLALTTAFYKNYLIWAFFDADYNFLGIGLTRKPKLQISAISSGGNQGTTGVFTVTDGFQFVNGARCIVRNTNGASPLYEYNWGTISSVSDTSISVDLDNATYYGTNITSATGAEILQMEKFQPYVVTNVGQTLYAPNYVLLGETTVKDDNSAMIGAYRADDPFRGNDDLVNGVLSVNGGFGAMVSFARYLPLWASQVSCLIFTDSATTAGQIQFFKGFTSSPQVSLKRNASISPEANTGYISLSSNIAQYIQITGDGNTNVVPVGFYVPGGMRL